jgi:hypothetical protein
MCRLDQRPLLGEITAQFFAVAFLRAGRLGLRLRGRQFQGFQKGHEHLVVVVDVAALMPSSRYATRD